MNTSQITCFITRMVTLIVYIHLVNVISQKIASTLDSWKFVS